MIAALLYRIGVLTDSTPKRGPFFRIVSRSSEKSLAVTPQGVSPKAGLSLKSVVSLRLGGGESAYLSNRVGRFTHARYKKLEGPLQKVALVPIVYTSESVIIPAAAEAPRRKGYDSQEY